MKSDLYAPGPAAERRPKSRFARFARVSQASSSSVSPPETHQYCSACSSVPPSQAQRSTASQSQCRVSGLILYTNEDSAIGNEDSSIEIAPIPAHFPFAASCFNASSSESSLQNPSCLIQNSLFLIHNSSFLILLIHNSSFLIQSSLF